MCSQKNKKSKFHGYASIILFFIAIGIGIYSVANFSLTMALLNVAALILMILSVSYYYCSKCIVRGDCNHWIFGNVSKTISKFNLEKYNTFDIVFGTILPISILVILPQAWLIKIPLLMILYWLFIALAAVDVLLFVCTKCENQKCAMCRNKVRNIQNLK